MADKMESVAERCALIDNATREAEDWRKRCMAIGEYVCANLDPENEARSDIMDLINNRQRTEEQKRADAKTVLTKLMSARDYAIRVREEGSQDLELLQALKKASLWPPPWTDWRKGDIE